MKYLKYNDMFEATIDKRTYEEVCYAKKLDPDMNKNDRKTAIRQFMLRPDVDVITSLGNMADGESKCEAFVNALTSAIKEDGEPWRDKCVAIAKALKSNNAQELLIALCGYNAGSLAKQAMVIPDDDEEFYKIGKQATLIVYWSNGEVTRSKCRIDVASNKVYGYKSETLTEYEGSAEIRFVAVEVKTAFDKNSYLRWCITKEEREKNNDCVTYWYSTDPEEAQHAAPAVWIDDPYC